MQGVSVSAPTLTCPALLAPSLAINTAGDGYSCSYYISEGQDFDRKTIFFWGGGGVSQSNTLTKKKYNATVLWALFGP